jgi:hypothetical protein
LWLRCTELVEVLLLSIPRRRRNSAFSALDGYLLDRRRATTIKLSNQASLARSAGILPAPEPPASSWRERLEAAHPRAAWKAALPGLPVMEAVVFSFLELA